MTDISDGRELILDYGEEYWTQLQNLHQKGLNFEVLSPKGSANPAAPMDIDQANDDNADGPSGPSSGPNGPDGHADSSGAGLSDPSEPQPQPSARLKELISAYDVIKNHDVSVGISDELWERMQSELGWTRQHNKAERQYDSAQYSCVNDSSFSSRNYGGSKMCVDCSRYHYMYFPAGEESRISKLSGRATTKASFRSIHSAALHLREKHQLLGSASVLLSLKEEPEGALDSAASTYTSVNNETPNHIAGRLGVPVSELVSLNADAFPEIKRSSKLMKATVLTVPAGSKIVVAAAAASAAAAGKGDRALLTSTPVEHELEDGDAVDLVAEQTKEAEEDYWVDPWPVIMGRKSEHEEQFADPCGVLSRGELPANAPELDWQHRCAQFLQSSLVAS